MDYERISNEVNRYIKSGTLVFILSGAIISFNHYLPSLFPGILKGFYEVLSSLRLIRLAVKIRQIKHINGKRSEN